MKKLDCSHLTALAPKGCHNQLPQTGWLKFALLQLRMSKIGNQDISRIGSFWRL